MISGTGVYKILTVSNVSAPVFHIEASLMFGMRSRLAGRQGITKASDGVMLDKTSDSALYSHLR